MAHMGAGDSDGACFTFFQVFSRVTDPTGLSIFEDGRRDQDKQECHSLDAAKLLEYDLKQTLVGVAHRLFGPGLRSGHFAE